MESGPQRASRPDPSRSQQRDAEAAAAEAALVALYLWAQTALLTAAGSIVASVPHTREGYQAAIPRLRAVTSQVLATLTVRTRPLVATLTGAAGEAGALAAEGEVTALIEAATPGTAPTTAPPTHLPPPPPTTGDGAWIPSEPDGFDLSRPHGERAAEAIATDLSSSLANVRERITRFPDDVYKAVAPHAAMYSVLDNGWTERQSQAEAWRHFLRHGVTGFTDRAGRRWSLATYVDMAVRTARTRAFNDSHLQQMRWLGMRFFQVPEHATSCPLCFPWQGQVLSDGLQPDPGVHVAGTLADAIAAGLFHPQCRHTLTAYLPGISDPPPPPPVWGEAEQQQYADLERQRRLERRVRAAKEAEALAIDPASKAAARKAVRAAQRAAKAHVDGKPHLSRNYGREQPHLGYPKVRTPQQ